MSYRERQEQEAKMLGLVTLVATLCLGALWVLWRAHG